MPLGVFEMESFINSDMFSLLDHSMLQYHNFGRDGYIYIDMLRKLSGEVATEFPKHATSQRVWSIKAMNS